MTLKEQAEFLEYMAGRCRPKAVTEPAATVTEVIFSITADEAETMEYIAGRMRKLVPHADSIKALVIGR